MKFIREIVRYLVAGLFIFSGLIKLNDPVGTQIKLEEYFGVFSYDFASFFSAFIPYALYFSVFLSVLEIVLGLALILGYRMKLTAWSLLVMILFFSFLTFYSAYFNKVTDCGCFGDAIKLTPWQSFTKDIVLLLLIGVIFWQKSHYRPFFNNKISLVVIGCTKLVLVILAVYAVLHLPFIDFRAYAIGKDLKKQMQATAELKYEYIVTKEGKKETFLEYPSEKGYELLGTRLLNPEDQPKITDLAVWNDEGDFTEEMLSGVKIIIVIHSATKASISTSEKLIEMVSSSKDQADIWIITSSGSEEIYQYQQESGLMLPVFYADATVLKTMIRSNPGILLLKDAVVLGKWHFRNSPSALEIRELVQ